MSFSQEGGVASVGRAVAVGIVLSGISIYGVLPSPVVAQESSVIPVGSKVLQSDDDEDADASIVRNAQPRAAEAVASGGGLKAQEKRVEDDSSAMWAVPPIPWRGQINLSEGASQQANGGVVNSGSRMLSLSGNSYIWQPWFARVNSSAIFSNSYASSAGSKSEADAISLAVGGDVVPASRYPISLSVGITNSTGSSGQQATKLESTSLNLRQSYSPVDASYNTNWSFFQNDSTAGGGNGTASKSSSTGLGWGLSMPIRSETPQSISLSGSWTSGKSRPSGATVDNLSMAGSHSAYFEDYVLSVNSDGSYLDSQSKEQTSAGAKTEYLTVGTVADWLPSDDIPLKLGGNARYYSVNSSSGGLGASSSNTYSASAFANYPTDFKVDLNGSLSAVLSDGQSSSAPGATSQSWQTQMQANWRPDVVARKIDWGNYTINYGGNSSFTYQSTSRSGPGAQSETLSVFSAGLSAGHSLGRSIDLAGARPIDLGLSQGYGLGFNDKGDVSHSLNHGLNLGWVAKMTQSSSHVLGLAISDSRSFGESEGAYQSLTGDWRGSGLISSFESFTTEARLQFSQQETKASSGRATGSGSVGASYTHNRFANVLGLIYTARYLLSIRESSPANGGAGASGGNSGFDLDHQITQQWAWRMGYLGWRIDNTIFYDTEGKLSASLYLSVVRDFAGVL